MSRWEREFSENILIESALARLFCPVGDPEAILSFGKRAHRRTGSGGSQKP